MHVCAIFTFILPVLETHNVTRLPIIAAVLIYLKCFKIYNKKPLLTVCSAYVVEGSRDPWSKIRSDYLRTAVVLSIAFLRKVHVFVFQFVTILSCEFVFCPAILSNS